AGGAGHHRLANRYTVTEHAIAYWSIAPRKGRKSSRDLLSEKPTAKASLPTGSDSGKSTAHATEPAAPAKVVPARAAPDVPRETGRLDFEANRVKTRPAASPEAPDRDRCRLQPP